MQRCPILIGPDRLCFLCHVSFRPSSLGAAKIERVSQQGRSRRPPHTLRAISSPSSPATPIMPIVTIAGDHLLRDESVFTYFGQNNNGVEFFVESEPEQAIIYVRARGNIVADRDKDAACPSRWKKPFRVTVPGIDSAFAFAGVRRFECQHRRGRKARPTPSVKSRSS